MASESEYTDGGDAPAPPSLAVADVKETLLTPLRIAVSPAFLRAYLRTLLLFITSSILFGLAVLAYSAFYYKYIPVRGIEVPVYLQVDTTPSLLSNALGSANARVGDAFGVAMVKGLVGRQKYDVSVAMQMPRSERNTGAGNWMVRLDVRGGAGGGAESAREWEEVAGAAYAGEEMGDVNVEGMACTGRGQWKVCRDKNGNTVPAPAPARPEPQTPVLASSSRPALMTHRSWLATHAHTLLRLPLYALNFRTEVDTVAIPMMEGVTLDHGPAAIAASVKLDIRSATRLDMYRVAVKFDAKLEGLRWVMYRHWILSAVVFTSAFWMVEVGVLVLSWAVFSAILHTEKGVKKEGGEHEHEIEGSGEESGEETPKRKRVTHGDSPPMTCKSEDGTTDAPLTPPSETSRAFPGYGAPATPHTLHSLQGSSSGLPRAPGSSSRRKIKKERSTPRLEDIPFAPGVGGTVHGGYHDENEDEDADFVLDERSLAPGDSVSVAMDSGIGTSLEGSRVGTEVGVRRRGSGKVGKGVVKREGGR